MLSYYREISSPSLRSSCYYSLGQIRESTKVGNGMQLGGLGAWPRNFLAFSCSERACSAI